MKINCDVAKDLLPLYADDLVNTITRERVEAHLADCEHCSKNLAALKAAVRMPRHSEKKIKKAAGRRVLLPVLAVALLVLTLLSGIYVYSAVPVWLSCEEAVVEIRDSKVGTVLEVTDRAQNMLYSIDRPEKQNKAMGISFWGYRNDWIHPWRDKNKVYLSGAKNYHSIWYLEGTDKPQCVLLQGDAQVTLESVIQNNEDIMQDRTLVYVFYLSLWTGLSGTLAGILLRKKKYGKTVCYFGLALLCCAVASIFVTDGRLLCVASAMSEMGFLRRFPVILIMTGLSFGTVVTMIESYIVLMGYWKKI